MIKAIAFDLDDTLLDTTGILVPKASAHAFQILINNGLRLTLAECQERRLQMIQTMSHKEVFRILADEFGNQQTVAAVPAAIAAFYEPQLPDTLPLLPGAIENIKELKDKYKLYIVTAGTESAQRSKAKSLGIEPYFEHIYVVNSLDKKRKEDAFLDIIKKNNLKNHELLCVGNSLSSEIFDAVKIGAIACYFEFGEERSVFPTDPKDQPHFRVRHHGELIAACKL
ncbi:MAG: HAD hydrolase-like protein [Bdellovibrio sp.]|nr:HAD hydrolase-like protein [Bdellovibrio sp.]